MSETRGSETRGDERPVDELSTAELVRRASEQISRLVRDELALARAELTEKGRHAGLGLGLSGASGAIALYGSGVLFAAVILLLAEAMPAWLAALIVAVGLLGVAAALALAGRRELRSAVPPVPAKATASVRADVDAVATAMRERKR